MEIGALIKEQYQVVEHIGRGGMADVWSARDNRLRRMVAIKTIAHGLTQEVDPIRLFEREAQTIARMEHPHILPIYDFGEYEKRLYIVMRYVTGGSLEDRLQGGALEPKEVLRLGRAIAQALDHAHQNNVIHLDLKPPNILLDSASTPYLADFGLATVLDPEGRAHNPGSGTLLYMAPEQLIAEIIDHRADIYSFTIMLYHMFTGRLPFGGAQPLALRQLQMDQMLPDPREVNPDLPNSLGDILREGTAPDPDMRPSTLMMLVESLENALLGVTTMEAFAVTDAFNEFTPDLSPLADALVQAGDDTLLEAVDIYTRARHVWAGGQGRFLLGVTHFMLMSDYYAQAKTYGLGVDDVGYQMLLRGALEYDYEIQQWWSKVPDDDQRRLVALHTLRTGTAPARIRALARLETLPDDPNNPLIPKLVGQALEVEGDEVAKLAALRVLNHRSRLIRRQEYELDTQHHGRLMTTVTRLGIQLAPPSVWREIIYSPEIDLLVANQCFDDERPAVAEYAARTIGQMRSLTALRFLAKEQRNGRVGALRALAYVRDEAPTLPDVVSPQARFYAWLTNTFRRITDKPLDGILRFVLALIGGWIGMGQIIYITYRSQALFTPQRWGNTLAIGLVFGLFVALTVMAGDELSRRLRGFWSWSLRLLVFGVAGFFMGMMTWAGFTWMYLQYIPLWDVMRLAGFALGFSLTITALLDWYGWRSLILTTVLNAIAVYALHESFYNGANFSVTLVAPLGLIVGSLIGWQASRLSQLAQGIDLFGKPPIRALLAGIIGVIWVGVVAFAYDITYTGVRTGDAPMTWDTVLLFFTGATVVGGLAMYWLKPLTRSAFLLTSLVGFALFYANTAWQFTNQILELPSLGNVPTSVAYIIGTPFAPIPETPLVYFDRPELMPHIVLPMLFVIALGINGVALWRGWSQFIGQPRQKRERNAWATGGLIYLGFIATTTSVLALFSAHQDVAWALLWSAWGFVTFVATLATWRFTLWGGRLLIACLVAFIAGGVLYDLREISIAINDQALPALFLPVAEWGGQLAITFWMVIALWVGVFTWGALRRKLWGGIGFLMLIPIWFVMALITPLPPNLTLFNLMHVGFFAFVLQHIWSYLEPNRFPAIFGAVQPTMTPAPVGVQIGEPDEEVDTNTMPAVRLDLHTQRDPHLIEDDAPATEFDPAAHLDGMPERKDDAPATEFDPAAHLDGIPERKDDASATEFDPAAHLDEDAKPKKPAFTKATELPRIKLDTTRTDKPEPSAPRIKLDTTRTDKPEPSAPRIKLDTTRTDKPEPSAPRIKLDTTRTDKPEPSAPRIKLDTTRTSKPEPTTPRIKLDTTRHKPADLKTQIDPQKPASDDDDPPKKPDAPDADETPPNDEDAR